MTLDRAPWYLAGPLIGLIMVLLRATLNKPFGALGGYIDLFQHLKTPKRWGAPAFIALGIVIGGFVFALLTRSLSSTFNYGPGLAFMPATASGQFLLLTVTGVVMGFGGRLAGGCTSGHGLCGISLGSQASIASTITFFATAVLLAHLFAALTGGA